MKNYNKLYYLKIEIEDLKKEIENIKERNKRVELDKKWETSLTRKLCICILTYIVVVIYSYMVRNYDKSVCYRKLKKYLERIKKNE